MADGQIACSDPKVRGVRGLSVEPRRIVARYLIGSTFIIAASLKFYAIARYPNYFELLASSFELALGLFLVLDLMPVLSWFASLVAIVAFLSANAMLVIRRASSCGCFGDLKVDPRLTLMLDVLLLAVHCWGRPDFRAAWAGNSVRLRGSRPLMNWRPEALRPLLTVALASIVISAGLLFVYRDAVASSLVPDASVVPFAREVDGTQCAQEFPTSVTVANSLDRPIEIVGFWSQSCRVRLKDSLPLTVPPHGRMEFSLLVDLRDMGPGQFRRAFEFYFESTSLKSCRGEVRCQVTPPSN
jgi:hypothetical protein